MDDSTVAILGRQPELGLAELESLFGNAHVKKLGTQAARLDIMPCAIDFSRLGGTIKLCKLLTVLHTTSWGAIEKYLVQVSPGYAERMSAGKMHLGLSAYDISVTPSQLLASGLKIKKAIQANGGRSVRLVPNKTSELNSAQVLHNRLTGEHGWELVFVRDGNDTIIAQTLSIQDIEAYSERDYNRPRRDAKVGMLPPKLAQIMVNLAIGPDEFETVKSQLSGDVCMQPEDNEKMRAIRSRLTLLDPFCGTGVTLQEALLMGYRLYGTDLEPRMVESTRVNLDWLRAKPVAEPTLEVADASTYTWQTPVDFVTTEAYLGRPFTGQPTSEVLAQVASDCNLIIKKFLQNIHRQLAPGTRLCVAVPAWQLKPGTFRHLPLVDQIENLGYNRMRFEHVRNEDLLYYRSDQIVARELLVITRK